MKNTKKPLTSLLTPQAHRLIVLEIALKAFDQQGIPDAVKHKIEAMLKEAKQKGELEHFLYAANMVASNPGYFHKALMHSMNVNEAEVIVKQ